MNDTYFPQLSQMVHEDLVDYVSQHFTWTASSYLDED